MDVVHNVNVVNVVKNEIDISERNSFVFMLFFYIVRDRQKTITMAQLKRISV